MSEWYRADGYQFAKKRLGGSEKVVSWKMSMLTVLGSARDGKSEKARRIGVSRRRGWSTTQAEDCHGVESIKVIPYGSTEALCTLALSYHLVLVLLTALIHRPFICFPRLKPKLIQSHHPARVAFAASSAWYFGAPGVVRQTGWIHRRHGIEGDCISYSIPYVG